MTMPIAGHIGFIGDSLSVGDPTKVVPPDVPMMVRLNADKLVSSVSLYSSFNQAVGGTNSSHWVSGEYIDAAISVFEMNHVGTVCIMLGTNDTRVGIVHTKEQYKANILLTITALLADGVQRVILNKPPWFVVDSNFDPDALSLLNQYGDALVELSEENPAHVFVGDMSAFSYIENHPELLLDGVHLTDAGYTTLGNLWAQAFESVFPDDFIVPISEKNTNMIPLIRSLTNLSSINSINLGIVGFDPTESISISTNSTLDLLSVMTVDSLHAMQAQLQSLVAAGEATVAATIDSSALYPAAMLNLISSNDAQVVFSPTSGSATFSEGATSVLNIENSFGVTDVFDNSTIITITATPNGETTPLINGHLSPISIVAYMGVANILVTSSGSDTITCAISAISRTLLHNSVFVATLS